MPSIIEDLQAMAYNSTVPISDLLRRAKVAATKLGLSKTVAWVDSELNGYTAEVPDYRRVPVRLVYLDMVHGWQPIEFADAIMDVLSEPRALTQSIRELEELAAQADPFFFLTFPPGVNRQFEELGAPGEVRSQFGRATLVGILDTVRTRVLDWALELEQNGIRGDGVSFSADEKQLAKEHAPAINFYGAVGNIAGPIGVTNGSVSVHATQNYTASVTETDARKVVLALREGAKTASEDDATLVNQIADDIEDAAQNNPADQGRIKQALRLAKTLVPRLVLWGGRVAAEAEIGRLLGGG